MNTQDFEVILANNALVTPQPNKLKDGNPLEHYAVFAFPAEAQATLWNLLVESARAAWGIESGFEYGIKTNKASTKPILGVPDDSIMVRTASQYPTKICDETGMELSLANPEHVAYIKRNFLPGAHVRAILKARSWEYKPKGVVLKKGVSLDLHGIMFVPSNAPKLNLGGVDAEGAFKQFAQPGNGAGAAGVSPFGGQPAQGGQSAAAGAGAAANATASAQGAGANPFGSAGGASGDPFQQQASGAGAQSANPFA